MIFRKTTNIKKTKIQHDTVTYCNWKVTNGNVCAMQKQYFKSANLYELSAYNSNFHSCNCATFPGLTATLSLLQCHFQQFQFFRETLQRDGVFVFLAHNILAHSQFAFSNQILHSHIFVISSPSNNFTLRSFLCKSLLFTEI